MFPGRWKSRTNSLSVLFFYFLIHRYTPNIKTCILSPNCLFVSLVNDITRTKNFTISRIKIICYFSLGTIFSISMSSFVQFSGKLLRSVVQIYWISCSPTYCDRWRWPYFEIPLERFQIPFRNPDCALQPNPIMEFQCCTKDKLANKVGRLRIFL